MKQALGAAFRLLRHHEILPLFGPPLSLRGRVKLLHSCWIEYVRLHRLGMPLPLVDVLRDGVWHSGEPLLTPNTLSGFSWLLNPRCVLCRGRIAARREAFRVGRFGVGERQNPFRSMSRSWSHRTCLGRWSRLDEFIAFFNATSVGYLSAPEAEREDGSGSVPRAVACRGEREYGSLGFGIRSDEEIPIS